MSSPAREQDGESNMLPQYFPSNITYCKMFHLTRLNYGKLLLEAAAEVALGNKPKQMQKCYVSCEKQCTGDYLELNIVKMQWQAILSIETIMQRLNSCSLRHDLLEFSQFSVIAEVSMGQ